MNKYYKKIFPAVVLILSSSFSFSQQTVFPIGGVPGACGIDKTFSKTVSPMDGSNGLGQSFNQSMCGLNYVAATQIVETRYNAYTTAGNYGCGLPCSWSISGLPTCIVPVKALVWALCSYTEAGPPAATISITNPNSQTQSYAGTMTGTSVSKCWAETGTCVYRFDVTPSIASNGTYGFNITGLSNPTWEIDGATIFIIYQDLSATYDGSLIFWDGAYANNTGGTISQTLTGFNVCATPSTATAFMLTSDHQDNIGPSHTSTMNGVPISFPNSFSNFQVAATTLTAGQNSTYFDDSGGGGDCFLWGMAGLYYQSNCTGCTPQALTLSSSSTPASCGNNNGTATVTPSGPNPPFTYTWSPNVSNTNTANGLAAGTYNVTVCNGPGCCQSISIVVGSSTAPTVSTSSTPAGCSVSNGTATANASGGTAPYTYSWNTTPVQNTQTANNLPSGTYVVTITDATGCSAQASVVVGGSNAPTVTASANNPAGCSVANGSATANPTGGLAPYTYQWSPIGGNGQTANNLPAGTYTVIVTDANGCSSFTTVTIVTSPPPTVTASVNNNAKCNAQSNGSATANPAGGNAPYTYAWSPSGGNAQTANNLGAGTYTVLITDANGCTATSTVAITQPTAVAATITQNNPKCFGNKTGSATATGSGGTAPYNYSWNTVPVQNTQTATGLGAGTYNCTVTDANGCTSVVSVTITQPNQLTAVSTNVNPKCNGGKGSATATMNGGSSPYTYAWGTNPVQNTQTATGLTAGTYTVLITDANGCTATSTAIVTQPTPVVLNIACGDSICNGKSTTLTGSASGGTPSYTYVWLPGPKGGSTISVNPSSSTTYTLTVSDANGCTAAAPLTCKVVVLPQPNANFDTLSGGYLSTMYQFTDSSTGPPTSWWWNFGDAGSQTNTSNQQNPIHTFSGAGTYTVTEVITNKYGCNDTALIIVKVGEGILIPNVFTPDDDGHNDVWFIPNSGMKEFHVEIYDRWGLKVWEATADEIRWDGRSSAGKPLNDGTYYFMLHAILKSGSAGKDYSTKGYVTLLRKN